MGWAWGGRTHCRESLEEVHWALKDAGDFTKQKRGVVVSKGRTMRGEP